MAEFRKLRIDASSTSERSVSDRRAFPDPPGYDPASARPQGEGSAVAGRRAGPSVAVRQAALFNRATGSLKQVGMLAFMMWMSGAQLHLFSIMTTLSGVYQPLSAILNSGHAFPPDPDGKLNTLGPRLLFCAINAGGLLFAVHRINGMGLLPTHLSDWVGSIKPPHVLDHAAPTLLGGH